ncbi:putative glycoside hydrolase family 61 protein [Lyophyllum shimeji]|uniref:AA9 family lytic polysaccharide monooxygenase n=1 Tax=Lyophyllum shimeji TaxID=47721 RepID=A0A9P3PZI0_LYOSH|nr:putative glycoside hydrolase family 61 protein [Lyophyllum shimeji]
MKFAATLLALGAVAQTASAHYIFNTLIAGDKTSTNAVRQPQNNSPVKPVTSPDMVCNVSPGQATETVTVNAGDTIGFKINTNIYHQGPAAIYLGKAPDTAASWDGSGANWFKIAEWGAKYNPFGFTDVGMNQLTTTIPKDTPSGEYLVRAEQIGLHVIPPESFMSCAQIKIVNGGSGNPMKVSIPGYIKESDSSVNVNIYPPDTPTSYTCPGPAVWRG